jgi:hypothetical protein
MQNKAKLNAERLDKVRMGLVKDKDTGIVTVISSIINCFKNKENLSYRLYILSWFLKKAIDEFMAKNFDK